MCVCVCLYDGVPLISLLCRFSCCPPPFPHLVSDVTLFSLSLFGCSFSFSGLVCISPPLPPLSSVSSGFGSSLTSPLLARFFVYLLIVAAPSLLPRLSPCLAPLRVLVCLSYVVALFALLLFCVGVSVLCLLCWASATRAYLSALMLFPLIPPPNQKRTQGKQTNAHAHAHLR